VKINCIRSWTSKKSKGERLEKKRTRGKARKGKKKEEKKGSCDRHRAEKRGRYTKPWVKIAEKGKKLKCGLINRTRVKKGVVIRENNPKGKKTQQEQKLG